MSVPRLILRLLCVGMVLLIACACVAFPQEDGDDIVIGKYYILQSKILNEPRTLLIHLPNGYEASNLSYPVVYLLYVTDVTTYFAEAVSVLDRLNETGKVPQVILVGIKNTDYYRDFLPLDRSGGPGGAGNFLRFFKEELIPYVDNRYRTKDYRILLGPQTAATFALYALCEDPGVFRAAIVNDPFKSPYIRDYSFELTEKFFGENKTVDNYFFITFGPVGIQDDERKRFVDKFAELVNSSNPAGFRLKVEYLADNNDFILPTGIKPGLEELFKDYLFPADLEVQGLDDVKEFYGGLSAKFGFTVDIPEPVITRQGDKLLEKGEVDKAIEIFNYTAELYPTALNPLFRLGNIARQRGDLDTAVRYFTKCLEINPDIAIIKKLLKEIEEERQEKR
jgi:tetratricopeptide (TPR) repeat protein